jgi:uncharacterized protein YndB with AHSA1/START domain
MTDTNTTLAEDFGQLDQRDGRVVLTYIRRLPRPPEVVWRALTEPDHLAAWFPTTIDGDRAAGARLSFAFRDMDMPPMDGQMLVFEPPSVMELLWGPDGLRFELRPDGSGSVLVFTATLEELGKASRDGAGWHSCLDHLVTELGGDQVTPCRPIAGGSSATPMSSASGPRPRRLGLPMSGSVRTVRRQAAPAEIRHRRPRRGCGWDARGDG